MAICTGVSNFFQKTLEVFELKKIEKINNT